MTIEKSHGKARPSLVRSSDLQQTGETERKPSVERTPDGRFAPGNRAASGSGFRRTTKKLLGPSNGGMEERIVRRDAWRVFVATMATMPSDAAPVRTLVGLHSRHVALAALYASLASDAGLGTDEGRKLQESADRQSQRAERVLVTALDVARVCAQREEYQRPTGLALLHAAVAARQAEAQAARDDDDDGGSV